MSKKVTWQNFVDEQQNFYFNIKKKKKKMENGVSDFALILSEDEH